MSKSSTTTPLRQIITLVSIHITTIFSIISKENHRQFLKDIIVAVRDVCKKHVNPEQDSVRELFDQLNASMKASGYDWSEEEDAQ